MTRRKSVTFTPETKQEDGFSAVALSQQSNSEQESSIANLSTIQQTQSLSKRDKKRVRTKGDQPASHVNGLPESARQEEVPEYVKYLEHHNKDRALWKFNKKKQTGLLANLFNVYRVPVEHNQAILQYLAGLQGGKARERVVESATAVLKAIAEKDSQFDSTVEMESHEARRGAYNAALRQHIERHERSGAGRSEYDDQQLEEMRQEVERGKRAEAVLGQLLQQDLRPEDSRAVQSSTPTANFENDPRTSATNDSKARAITKPKRRKRKSRTQAFSDESSSDSSEGETPVRGPGSVHDALSTYSNPNSKVEDGKPAAAKPKANKHIIFDDDLLDQMFPKKPSYHQTAPKRKPGDNSKARDFAYTHGTRVDESGSEEESDGESDDEADDE